MTDDRTSHGRTPATMTQTPTSAIARTVTAAILALGLAALACVGLATLHFAAPIAAARSEPDAAAKDRLVHLLVQDCGSCHGLTLRGGLGKPLTSDSLRIWDREQLVGIILDGVPGTPMPPWRTLLSETDARWIAERLQQGNLP